MNSLYGFVLFASNRACMAAGIWRRGLLVPGAIDARGKRNRFEVLAIGRVGWLRVANSLQPPRPDLVPVDPPRQRFDARARHERRDENHAGAPNHRAVQPPSTTSVAPVMYADAGEARK